MVYDRLMPPKELTLAQIREIVGRNSISEFLGAFENEFIDFKGEVYRLDDDSQKLELAKDISAFANAAGGYIVIGIKVRKEPEYSADVADELRPIPKSRFNTEQYQGVARGWVYPPLDALRITLIDSAENPEKVFAILEIPEGAAAQKPYLLVRATNESTAVVKRIAFGYAERVRSSSFPASVQRLQHLLHLGSSLENYELLRGETHASLSKLSEQVKRLEKAVLRQTQIDETAGKEKREQAFVARLRVAAKQSGFVEVPHLVLGAFPEPEAKLDSLFSSNRAPIVDAFENPPEFRDAGFDFALHKSSEIVQGVARRVSIPGYKSMELSVRGELIVLLRGDEDFLAWASNMKGLPDVPIRINSFVLGEVLYAFAVYVKNIYALLEPTPKASHLFVGLSDMTRSGKPAVLSSAESGLYVYESEWNRKQAPDTSHRFSFEVPANESAERIFASAILPPGPKSDHNRSSGSLGQSASAVERVELRGQLSL
jgi:hypothetical protein